jgi:hypothetical protein
MPFDGGAMSGRVLKLGRWNDRRRRIPDQRPVSALHRNPGLA